jgi:hypothetical protein
MFSGQVVGDCSWLQVEAPTFCDKLHQTEMVFVAIFIYFVY